MKKYNCNKTLDFLHEFNRMCDTYDYCDNCSFMTSPCPQNNLLMVSQKDIDIVQKWSDEHPEPPKIRKRELDFIAMFKWSGEKWIERTPGGSLRFVTKNECCGLCDEWFSFIGNGESMTFKELLKMEVEE